MNTTGEVCDIVSRVGSLLHGLCAVVAVHYDGDGVKYGRLSQSRRLNMKTEMKTIRQKIFFRKGNTESAKCKTKYLHCGWKHMNHDERSLRRLLC